MSGRSLFRDSLLISLLCIGGPMMRAPTNAGAAANFSYSASSATGASGNPLGSFEAGPQASSALLPPARVSATDGTVCGRVRVSWNQVVGAKNYQVYRAADANGAKTAISSWQAGVNYDDTTVPGGSAYYYWVKAALNEAGGGASDFSASDSGFSAEVPAAPAEVVASAGTLTRVVRVTWNSSAGATGYEVYRDGTLVGIAAGTPFDDAPGDAGVHQYAVKAFNVCGAGPAGIAPGGSAGSLCPQTPLLTDAAPGALRDNYTGWVGMRFVVGSVPLQVRALGRIYVNGNTQTHELRLVHATTKATVASVLWTPAGGIHNQISYTQLASPVTLTANTEYYLAAKETEGGDSFCSVQTSASTTGVVKALSAIDSDNGNTWTHREPSGASGYGPVNLMYCGSLNQLLPPIGVSAGEGTSGDKVQVSWNLSSGAASYKVYRSIFPTGTRTELSSWQAGTSYDDLTAIAGLTYYYWIKAAADSSGRQASDFSAPHAGWRALPPLPPPRTVAASNGTWIDKVRVTWDAVAGATHYQVFRAESEAGIKTAISPWLTGIRYDDITTTAGSTYLYWIKASADGSGGRASDLSTAVMGRRALGDLNPATGVSATDGTFCGRVRLIWDTVSGATHYQVYRASPETGTKTAITPWQDVVGYDDTSAAPGSIYYYWVKAANNGEGRGSSEYSPSDSGYVRMAPPAPTGVTASDGTFVNAVRITWNASMGATSYEVYRDGTLLGSSPGPPYDDAPGDVSVHQYMIRAKNDCGASAGDASDAGHVSCNCCTPAPLFLPDGGPPGTRNTQDGWVGMRFQVQANPLVVRALGRIYANGNTQNHELRLILAAKNTIVASVLWTAAGGMQNQVRYATLPSPVILAANTEYYIASKESSTGDLSYNYNMVAAPTGDASVISPVYSDNGSAWTPPGTTPTGTYGPVNLMYCISSQQFLPPKEVAASDGAFSDKVRVTWNAVNDATHYQVYRSASAEGTKTAITPWQPGTTFDDSTAPVGLPVYYRVKAALDGNGGQASDFSAVATGLRSTPTMNPPTGVSASDGTLCGIVRVHWNAVDGATHYQLYRATSETGTKVVISPWQAAITYDDLTATGSTYFYWVRAAMDGSGGGAGDYSSSDIGFAGRAPSAPPWLSASDGSYPGIVRLTWDESAGAAGYDVYRDGILVGKPRVPTYDDAPGDSGVHQYMVAARNVCGISPFSPPDRGNAGALPPCEPISLLTGATLGTLGNNYSGWAGINFVVGSSPLQVSALGRIYIDGNSRSHQLRLVHAATGAIVASVQWTPAGGTPNQMNYVTLPSPVFLAANTEYYLASQEEAGGDSYYSYNTRITTTTATAVLSPVQSDDGILWRLYGTPGSYGYGPLDLKYCESRISKLPASGF
jgi:fibronectin type 3 domain-containing protein